MGNGYEGFHCSSFTETQSSLLLDYYCSGLSTNGEHKPGTVSEPNPNIKEIHRGLGCYRKDLQDLQDEEVSIIRHTAAYDLNLLNNTFFSIAS